MLRITDDRERHCLILEPTGSLTRSDLDRLRETFDRVVAETDRAPSLVVHSASFPTWADLGALARHLRFIREHHKMVPRVALVSDARVLDAAPLIARRLVAAEIRHFPDKHLPAALDWVAESPAAPQVTVLEGLPDDTVGISVAGAISAQEYAGTILPLIEDRLERHDHVKLLYRIGPELESFTAGAVWNDGLVGLSYLTGFSRVAIVSDIGWIRHAVRALAPLVPAEIDVFAEEEQDAAKAWLAIDPPVM